eukprot:13166028-Ditylum_brightwellii.AAC.1
MVGLNVQEMKDPNTFVDKKIGDMFKIHDKDLHSMRNFDEFSITSSSDSAISITLEEARGSCDNEDSKQAAK